MGVGTNQQSDPLLSHRTFLEAALEKEAHAYDKAVMTLSGGALAVSFAFVKDIIGGTPDPITMPELFCAWIFLSTSMLSCLGSMLTSQFALYRAIVQVDRPRADPASKKEPPGGGFGIATWILNISAGCFFGVGVIFLVTFAAQNLGRVGQTQDKAPSVTSVSPTATLTATPTPVP